MAPRPVAAAILALAVVLGGCGYRFTQRYEAAGGVRRIHVRLFENRSSEPDLGALVTAALRSELARRGADAGEGAAAVLEGLVIANDPVLTSTSGVTWRIGIEVRARFVPGAGAPALERIVRRETDYLGGGDPRDPLESEGRRALALRRAAEEAARELLRAIER